MLDQYFAGLFDSSSQSTIAPTHFLLCMGVSLAIGLVLALAYGRHSRGSQGFTITLAILPTVVCVVILLVNGNLGAGVAVAGTFSLVRFRSVPGTAREIGAIFVAMAVGLITGMGYLGYGVLFAVVMTAADLLCTLCGLGTRPSMHREKLLRITIPEELDYTGAFDDLFSKYTVSHQLVEVKTTNMGSLFRLSYQVVLKDLAMEKELLDAIRCRNGNLEILLSKQSQGAYEL